MRRSENNLGCLVLLFILFDNLFCSTLPMLGCLIHWLLEMLSLPLPLPLPPLPPVLGLRICDIITVSSFL